MNRKILFFINPVSGTSKKSRLQQIISDTIFAGEIPFEILFTNANGCYPDLPDKIKRENITDVAICGGDGTVSQVAAALLGVKVNIGIIPVGSGNGLAFAAKIPKRIEKALQIIFTGTPTLIDGFFINEKFSCMLCGVGFDAQVAHDFSLQKRRGLKTYLQLCIKNFISAKPYQFDISVNEKTFSTAAYFISIANSNQFGNNFTIAPKASLTDGLLDVVVVKKMSKTKMIFSLLQQLRWGEVKPHEEFHKKEVMYFQTDKLIIHNHELAPFHIDGEPAETDKKFKIGVLPNAFKLIMP
jgi:YegS/Rv2252/BmrU family lipid kinase